MAADRDGSADRVTVLLDTNALMLPVQFGIDIFSELERILGQYQPVVLRGTLEELERIAQGTGDNAVAARVGRTLAERCHMEGDKEERGDVDTAIIRFAERNQCAVVTNDLALKKILQEKGIRVISMRKLKRLDGGW
ncbi:MAG: nucleotide-binding protein [Methanomicrobiales archaeon]|nr:nucleotide-binding protein [Methanomicrobiales archaeon]